MVEHTVFIGLELQEVTKLLKSLESAFASGGLDEAVEQHMGLV